MKTSKVVFEIFIAVATVLLSGMSWHLALPNLRLDFVFNIVWPLLLFVLIARMIHKALQSLRSDIVNQIEAVNLKMDLWFRLVYQTSFVDQIRSDAEEKKLYQDSIVRKLHALADFNRKHPDDTFCAYFIGCLAFLSNPKRADIPWSVFRDAVVTDFGEQLLQGKISPHLINDHYKGKFADLMQATRRNAGERLALVSSKPQSAQGKKKRKIA